MRRTTCKAHALRPTGLLIRRPSNPIIITPSTYRHFSNNETAPSDLLVFPTSFGAREPTLPIARTITVSRIATAEGVDKRYERSWIKGLQQVFTHQTSHKSGIDSMKMVKRGDVITCPIWIGKPITSDDPVEEPSSDSDSNDDGAWGHQSRQKQRPTALAYFLVTALSYEPLNPLEEDFRSSVSSKARAGELGCWIDAGKNGQTRMVLTGVERNRICHRGPDRLSWGIGECFTRS